MLVRFFTGEPPKQGAKVRTLVEKADAGEITLLILPVIIAETFYTLESFYELERATIAEKLIDFLHSRGIQAVELDRILNALERCIERKAHFADAYLAAAAIELQRPVSSFDRDFDKFLNVVRIEPI